MMSNVVPLIREIAPARIPDPPPYRRLRLYSRVLALLLGAIAIVLAVVAATVLVAMLAYKGPLLKIGPTSMLLGMRSSPGFVAFGSLPLMHRLAYVFVGLARVAPELAIVLRLRTLFALYSQEVVFARSNAACLRDVGVLLALDAILPFACHLLLSAGGYEIDHVWFHFMSVQELVAAALVLGIAGVMYVGRDIQEERSQFV